MYKRSILLIATMIVAACAKETTTTTSTATSSSAPPPPATTSSAPAQTADITEGLQTPESVLYDAKQDVYFISNINGQATAADNNGYVLRVNADTLKAEKLIEAKPELRRSQILLGRWAMQLQ